MNLTSKIKSIADARQAVIDQITEALRSVEQNENIEKVAQNCYVMSSKHLSKDKVLAPHYYDFKASCKLLIAHMPQDIEKFEKFIQSVVDKKRIPIRVMPQPRIHEDLVKLLCEKFDLKPETNNKNKQEIIE